MAGRGTDILLGGNPEYLARDILAQRGVEEDDITDEQGRPRSRGTGDLRPGGSAHRADAGGLAVIGTERHESRRIDNQLRGRSGRQGDQDPRSSTSRSRTTS